MKKRKKPVVLTTVLVLMVAAVAIANFPKELLGKANAPAPGAPETGKEIEVPDKNDIAKDVSKSMGAAKRPPKPAPGQPSIMPGNKMPGEGEMDRPAIALAKPAPYKPKPSDSSTSTQWYSTETPKAIPGSKN